MKKIKTILIGTPEFAKRIFERFLEAKLSDFDIVAVITAPDKPIGRKQILTPSPVKKWALENNLPVLQLEKIGDPDLIILTAYGQIIPKEILDIPKFGALNIHPSLLPKYRGASPIQAAILNNDKETGITIILMDEKMDHGPIISNFQFPISNKITYQELSEKLADLGAQLLITTLPDYVNGRIKPRPQNHSRATFTKIIKKEDGKIDWNKSAEEIERQIRAFSGWPTAFTFFNNKQLKILEVGVNNKNTANEPGKVSLDENKNIGVQTGNGILVLKEVQLEGKRPMTAKDFLNGHPRIIGAILK